MGGERLVICLKSDAWVATLVSSLHIACFVGCIWPCLPQGLPDLLAARSRSKSSVSPQTTTRSRPQSVWTGVQCFVEWIVVISPIRCICILCFRQGHVKLCDYIRS